MGCQFKKKYSEKKLLTYNTYKTIHTKTVEEKM